MEVNIVAFGIAKDILGANRLKMSVQEGTVAGDMIKIMCSEYPKFDLLASIKLAVNESYVDEEYIIQPGDEVVIIPPVSGG